jgi:hypothetical protein
MGRKPKAGGTPKQDPAQSARFIEAARQAGVDETGDAFERAFDKIARQKPPDSRARGDGEKPPRQKR